MFCKKGVRRNFAKFTGKHLCQSLFFNKVAGLACNFIKKEALAQVFSCEFCEISKNINLSLDLVVGLKFIFFDTVTHLRSTIHHVLDCCFGVMTAFNSVYGCRYLVIKVILVRITVLVIIDSNSIDSINQCTKNVVFY